MIVASVSPFSDAAKTRAAQLIDHITRAGDGGAVMDVDPREGASCGSQQRCATRSPRLVDVRPRLRRCVSEGTQEVAHVAAHVLIDVPLTQPPITLPAWMYAGQALVPLRPAACLQEAADLPAVRMLLDVHHGRARWFGARVISGSVESSFIDQRAPAWANQRSPRLASAAHQRAVVELSVATGERVRSVQAIVPLEPEARGLAR